jgi:type 1 glutamine amidotransferase
MKTKQTIGLLLCAIAFGASLHCKGDDVLAHVVPDASTGGAAGSRSAGAGGGGKGGASGEETSGGSSGSGGNNGMSGSGGTASGGASAAGAGGQGTAGVMVGSGGTAMPGAGGRMTADAGAGGAMTADAGARVDASIANGPIRVLLWNTALTYGHQSRITAIPVLEAQAAANNIQFDTRYAHTQTLPEGTVDSTSDPSVFTDEGLDAYDVIFFLNTTGNTIDSDGNVTVHRQALTDFIEKKGRGFVGTHSATDTYDSGWTWYTDFIGANFSAHANANTPGSARWSPGLTHPILTAAAVPNPWNRSEEWYAFTRDPLSSAIPGITVLLTCTDTSNQFGERPSAWVHDMPGGGRMFYTAFGHFVSAFQEKAVMDMIVAGIKWAAHRL